MIIFSPEFFIGNPNRGSSISTASKWTCRTCRAANLWKWNWWFVSAMQVVEKRTWYSKTYSCCLWHRELFKVCFLYDVPFYWSLCKILALKQLKNVLCSKIHTYLFELYRNQKTNRNQNFRADIIGEGSRPGRGRKRKVQGSNSGTSAGRVSR